MADLTVAMACLPHELCSTNLPHSCSSQSHHSHQNASRHTETESDKVVIDHLDVCSCSNLCNCVEENTKQYNGNLQPETDILFSKGVKGSQNANRSSDDANDHHHGHRKGISQICKTNIHSHTPTPTIKLEGKGFDKHNGLTHHHSAAVHGYNSEDISLLVNVLNTYTGGEAPIGTTESEIHSFNNKDSDLESESSCNCITKVDSDYVSSDEIEAENICSPEVCCNKDNCCVDTLLIDLEKTNIHNKDNDNHHCNSEEFITSSDDVVNGVAYAVYESEKQMPNIMRLITKDLSEPYSIYTYRYFIHNWPKLCFLALCDTKCVGAIVCKLDLHKKMVRRGYIAMLAVDSEYRRRKIGSILVTKAIEAMIRDDCDEVVLETEITNQSALHLYENLGFVRDKRLFRYYLNGVDALRLKLWLR